MRKLGKGARSCIAAVAVWMAISGGDALAKSAVESPLPALTGPDRVGRTLLYWTDESRADADSPNGHREVAVWFWYPALPKQGATPAQWLPGKWADAFWSLFLKRFPSAEEYGRKHPVRDIVTRSYPDAPIESGSQTYPVVLFAPGFGENVLHYATLLEDLASHGYVVVGVDPTHYTGFGVLSDGRVPQDQTEVSGHGSDDPIRHLIESHAVILGDEKFVLQQLEKLNVNAGPFKGRLDLAHVGSIGHSIGASVATHIAAEDSHVVAAVNIDGTIAPGGSYPTKPLLILGESGIPLEQSFYRAVQAAKPGYLLVMAGTSHNFSTDMGLMPFLPPEARKSQPHGNFPPPGPMPGSEGARPPPGSSEPGGGPAAGAMPGGNGVPIAMGAAPDSGGPGSGGPMPGGGGIPLPAGAVPNGGGPAPGGPQAAGPMPGNGGGPAGAVPFGTPGMTPSSGGKSHVMGFPTATVGSQHPERTLADTRAYVEAFFDEYLKGKRTTLLDGPSPNYPDVSFKY